MGIPKQVRKDLAARVISRFYDAVEKRANLSNLSSRERLGEVWPHDALRHTFATYAMALHSDAPKVSVWLGHEGNPTMLHRHYRGLATKAQAEAFFALRPAT